MNWSSRCQWPKLFRTFLFTETWLHSLTLTMTWNRLSLSLNVQQAVSPPEKQIQFHSKKTWVLLKFCVKTKPSPGPKASSDVRRVGFCAGWGEGAVHGSEQLSHSFVLWSSKCESKAVFLTSFKVHLKKEDWLWLLRVFVLIKQRSPVLLLLPLELSESVKL